MVSNMRIQLWGMLERRVRKQFSAGGPQGGLVCGSFVDAYATSGSGLGSLKLGS